MVTARPAKRSTKEAPRPVVALLRDALTPLAAEHPGMDGWRFAGLVPASTGFDACFRRNDGSEARLRLIRPDPHLAWRSFPGVDATLIAAADGRLPEPGLPQDFLSSWLDRTLGGRAAQWPEWNPDPRILVVSSGIPRSGTAWVLRIARSLAEISGHFLGEPGCALDATLDHPGPLAQHEAAVAAVCRRHRRDPSHVRLVKAHYFAGSAATAHPAFRALFVYRDLRDVLVSQLDRALHGSAREHFAGLPPDEVFARIVTLTLPLAVQVLERLARRVPEQTLLVRYEHLLDDLGPQIRRIARFLGIDLPEELVDLLAETHRFRQEAGRDPGRTQAGAYHRRGVAGSWRDQLTPRQLERIADAVPDLDGLLARVDRRLAAQDG